MAPLPTTLWHSSKPAPVVPTADHELKLAPSPGLKVRSGHMELGVCERRVSHTVIPTASHIHPPHLVADTEAPVMEESLSALFLGASPERTALCLSPGDIQKVPVDCWEEFRWNLLDFEFP